MSNLGTPGNDRFDFSDEELNIDGAAQDWSAVERKIFNARNYVVPGDQLRPRTMEAAREVCDDQRRAWRLHKLAAALLLCAVILVPTLQGLSSWRDNRLVTDSSDLERRAQQFTHTAQFGGNWGLYEAFTELRAQQAERLGR